MDETHIVLLFSCILLAFAIGSTDDATPMKVRLLSFWLILTCAVCADLVIVEETFTGGKSSNRVTTSLGHDKARIDYGAMQSDIFDLKSGDFVGLIHQYKLYSRIAGKDYSSWIARADIEKPIPGAKSTGKKEIINGVECEIFVHKAFGVTTRLWVAGTHPLYAKYKSALKEMRTLNREPLLDGIILKSESKTFWTSESRRVISIREKNLPASVFLVPDGYKKHT